MKVLDGGMKELGQVFTPPDSRLILDHVGYTGTHLLHKKILEPSFGKGVFLTEIVKRYIHEALKEGWSKGK